MTNREIINLNLGIAPIDARVEIIINSGLEWLEKNTIIDVTDTDNFPNSAKLFLIKFFDLNMLSAGVTSESIEGLSQSFDNTDKSTLIWQYANELLSDYLKSQMSFVSAKRKWCNE